MKCHEFEADVVDLARGALAHAAAHERVAAHLERCAGCAARFARERELTEALKAVAEAEAEQPSEPAAAIEARLLEAFSARHAAGPRRATAPKAVFAARAARAWLAAAAILVLAAAVWQGVSRWPLSGGARSTPTEDVAGQAAPATDSGEGLRFVTLPTAIGLPALESGRVVRVAVPTAILPAYGLDVTPGLAEGSVEADVLVGQDGQPRAIRFVTTDGDSRRRQ